MIIEIKETIEWCPYHSHWGWASGRLAPVLLSKKECIEWCEENNRTVYTGKYTPLPYVRPQHLLAARIND